MIELVKKANRPKLVWYGGLNLIVIWIFVFPLLGNLGIIPSEATTIWVIGVVVLALALLVSTPFLFSWGTATAEEAYLVPLGLADADHPFQQP